MRATLPILIAIAIIIVLLIMSIAAALILPANINSFISRLIDAYSKVATIAALVIAIIAGWIALRTFTVAAASTRKAHMHKLFGDYLRLKFDYDLNGGRGKNDKHLDEGITSMKLYSLEAIFEWAKNERKLISKPIKFLNIDSTEIISDEIISCWEHTIKTHVTSDVDLIRDNLKYYSNCYNPDFVKFINIQPIPEAPASSTPIAGR